MRCGSRCTVDAMKHPGVNLILRLLLVLGLATGPWPAALAAVVPASDAEIALQPAADDVTPPCPMDDRPAVEKPCDCCDDTTPCAGAMCIASPVAPGLPVGPADIAHIAEHAMDAAIAILRPPRPGPTERLRPPIG